jgi:hypothetical protein
LPHSCGQLVGVVVVLVDVVVVDELDDEVDDELVVVRLDEVLELLVVVRELLVVVRDELVLVLVLVVVATKHPLRSIWQSSVQASGPPNGHVSPPKSAPSHCSLLPGSIVLSPHPERRATKRFFGVRFARRTPFICWQPEATVMVATRRTFCCVPQVSHRAVILVALRVPLILILRARSAWQPLSMATRPPPTATASNGDVVCPPVISGPSACWRR